MKYLKYNEDYKSSQRCGVFLSECWYNAKVGDIKNEDIIYQYVQCIHGNHDFEEGDLGERIERYSEYVLTELDIKEVEVEWWTDDDLVEEYAKEYKKSNSYPPLVCGKYYNEIIVIDGAHRLSSLIQANAKTVLAWIGR